MEKCCLCNAEIQYGFSSDPVRKDMKVCADCRKTVIDPVCHAFGAAPSTYVRKTLNKMDLAQLKGMISYLPKD